MSLSAFVALCAGMAFEILTLWESSRQRTEDSARPRLGPLQTLEQGLIGLVIILSLALVAVFELTGLAKINVYMGGAVDGIFIGLGLFLLYFGVVDPRLLPRVNEQTVLVVHTTIILNLLLNSPRPSPLILLALLVPTIGVLYLALTKRTISPVAKALVYLWYLVSLLLLAIQNDFGGLFSTSVSEPTLLESYITGAASIFLLLHSLFLIRFFLMVSSLIFPYNWRYMQTVMPKLFSDEQIPLWQVLVLEGIVVGIVVLNAVFGVASSTAVANILVLVAVWWMRGR